MAKSAGVHPQTGAQLYYAYENMDDNGRVTGEYITSDYTKAANSKYYCGDRMPDLYGSINTSLNLFKCIDLSVTTTYSIGGKILDNLYMIFYAKYVFQQCLEQKCTSSLAKAW